MKRILAATAATLAGLAVTMSPAQAATPTCFGGTATIDLNKAGHANPNRPQLDVIVGTPGNDVIYTGHGEDVVCGMGGDDYIIGGPGGDKDSLLGGAGNDFIEGGAGPDRIFGGDGRDVLVGDSDKDPLVEGDDWLYGEGGDDTLYPGNRPSGDDIVAGGTGRDTVSYFSAAGGVHLTLTNGAAQDTRGAGVDTLHGLEVIIGSGFADVITGAGANERIYGWHGADVLRGGGGNDLLFGHAPGTDAAAGDDAAADYLGGGVGNDGLYGGKGIDRCAPGLGDGTVRCEVVIS